MSKPVLLVNFKNYDGVLGEGAVRLALAVQKISKRLEVQFIVAPPGPELSTVAASVELPVFSQTVSDKPSGKSTGAMVPEALKAAGCAGSILNHSESRLSVKTIVAVTPRMRTLGLSACICGENATEVARFSAMKPEFLAVEPPELIGTGVAVSKARPSLLRETAKSVRATGYKGRLLCGAGIVTGDDARASMRFGMDGILVSSSVVLAKSWETKLRELGSALLEDS